MDLNISSDFEADFYLTRRNATTRAVEPATGLAGVQARLAATRGGAAIGALTASLTEAGTLGRYVGVFDAAALTTALTSYLGQTVYLICSKAGDIDAEFIPYRVVASHQVGT